MLNFLITLADIWSLGITALELTTGRVPNSFDPPKLVLSKLLENPAPVLDREGGVHKYSKSMSEMIESCLKKDPGLRSAHRFAFLPFPLVTNSLTCHAIKTLYRPTADKLLGHAFFKLAKKKSFLVSSILADLPPLEVRQQRRRFHLNSDQNDFC
jgi:serine/threonine-protein kinase OSR1/STK39